MHDIIPIFTSNFNNSQVNTVDARKLHEFLEVKTKFATWIQRKIEKYGFVENIDFITLSHNRENGGKFIEYHISTNMAKELSMLEDNSKGKQARLYFIEKEKQANTQIQPQQLSRLEILQIAIESEKKVLELKNTVKEKDEVIEIQASENQKLKTTIKDFFKGAELFTRRQVYHFLTRQGLDVKEQQITDFLNKKRWLCKGEYNSNKATADACKVGWFVNDIAVYEVKGRKKTSEYGKFTVDGLVKIYEHFKSN